MPRTAVIDDTPLGSLTQPGARTDRRCGACGSDRLTLLAMTLTDGTPVHFVSCRACEHRTWNAVGGVVDSVLPIDQVLARARKER
jgi:DNA-directed RNA polymerase subunit M/transcription elongation factor TFIIS